MYPGRYYIVFVYITDFQSTRNTQRKAAINYLSYHSCVGRYQLLVLMMMWIFPYPNLRPSKQSTISKMIRTRNAAYLLHVPSTGHPQAESPESPWRSTSFHTYLTACRINPYRPWRLDSPVALDWTWLNRGSGHVARP